MNRTGDIYMNRIALAVKSALGIAMLVPPAFAVAAAPDDNALQEIVVTGIRKSVDESLATKRASDEFIDVVTAEDIGKMPDKNVADSLSRLPGITTSYRATPDLLGSYPVVCNLLCGVGHSLMRSTIHVVTPAQFRIWLKHQTSTPSSV